MREYHYGLLTTAVLTCVVAQPALGANTQVKDIQVQSNGNGIALMLTTMDAQQELPQIFTMNQGNALVADLLDTQLQLSSGETYIKQNPHPEIGSVEISQLDASSVRIVVQGINYPLDVDIQPPDGSQIALKFAPSTNAAQNREVPTQPEYNSAIVQAPAPQSMPSQGDESTQERGFERVAPPTPEVLVPDPKITIDGVPAPAASPARPISPAPPFLPRAVAPPVGDIAVSNVDTSPNLIDLGTAALVPRVVLRDAPIREVLALLARSAGLNLVYTGTEDNETTISLDLENEPVQDVFNYVLQLSGLQANRRGQTIFAGGNLPSSAKNTIARSLRLNQVSVATAAAFLAAQGAESQKIVETAEASGGGTTGSGDGGTASSGVRQINAEIEQIETSDVEGGNRLLQGLSVVGDSRLNSITLIGEPRTVQIATSFLTQLDARRRQVAVNVKIVDVNLLNTEDYNSSFSFGIGDSFFSADGGQFTGNIGEFRPATSGQARSGLFSRPVIDNPFADAETFIDTSDTFSVPETEPGLTVINADPRLNDINDIFIPGQRGALDFFNRVVAIGDDPLTPQLVNVTPAENFIVERITTFDEDGNPVTTQTVTQGQPGTAEVGLPSLLRYPNRFLASLEAQVTSGNAKILTDPTLVVQEGQNALIDFTQEVFAGTEETVLVGPEGFPVQDTELIIKKVGLLLDIDVLRIDDNGFVTLEVTPTISSPGGTAEVETSAGTNEIVLINERTVRSGEIRVRDGQTIILAGIIQETDRTTVSKVPILGDLPLLGALFRSTNKNDQRSEVIVLLTPQILDDSERSAFGYNYTPGRNVRQVLQERGFPVQGR